MSEKTTAQLTGSHPEQPSGTGVQRLALAAGPSLALVVYLISDGDGATLTPAGRATLAVATWMTCWWLTESVSLAVTAMLPLVLFPLLGIAYSASIGGVATLIGTPPNLVLAGFLRERHGVEIGMLQWLSIGLPFALLMLPVAWPRCYCRNFAQEDGWQGA